ncbi:hypothetical protein N8I77_001200 [Diaporthe amygdali]|uniref:MPN domain-containing protein n=1 Tax=Phomopsis amygdali TaxID=1214568 RepID=A0AAD9SRD8_PHOAM|nr:hypothetical protein N8I77_001200 [Diaporthe amygdali]
MTKGDQGNALQALFGCCLGESSRPASPEPPAAPPNPAPAPAPAVPAPVPANGGAQVQAQEDIDIDVVIDERVAINLHNVPFQAPPSSLTYYITFPPHQRPASQPSAAQSERRTTQTRASCRPLSAAAFYGPPPSPPPPGPLPPLPPHVGQSQTSNSQQANTSQQRSNSQQNSNSQQTSSQQAVDLQQTNAPQNGEISQQTDNLEQLLDESQQTGTSQYSDNSQETSSSVQTEELLRINNSQQTSNSQKLSSSEQTDYLQQLNKQFHSPIMESAILHPLPLLNIGDYVTRHFLREQPGPIVGALFGQQNGREVTVEHAYEVQILVNGDQVTLEPGWFETRLEQMRLVHRDRTLDLVGWFTLAPRSGPGSHLIPIHNQILSYNESAILLGFHSEEIGEESVGGKLPYTTYETVYEVDDGAKDTNVEGEDKEMKDGDSQLKLKFKEIPFTVETHEAEMISMSSVAGAAANAASERVQEELLKLDVKGKGKGKGKQAAKEDDNVDPENAALSREDQEMIAALTTKANAIKMLKARIDLITKYLQRLPPPYIEEINSEVTDGDYTEPSQSLLRLVQALVHRLSIVEPSDAENFKEELLSEENDVNTIELLNELMNRVGDTRDIGKKFHVIETEKAHNSQRAATYASQGTAYGHSQPSKGGRPGSLPSAGDLM